MNSLEIFSSETYLYINCAAVLFFLMCGILFFCNQEKRSLDRAAKYLICAMVLDLGSVYYGSYINNFSAYISINYLMALSLVIKLIIFVLSVMAASLLMNEKNTSINLISGILAGVGLLIVIYCSLIEPNGRIINILHNLMPAIGFAYITTAFFIRSFRKYNSGAIIGCLTSIFITYITMTNISERDSFSVEYWYTGSIAYLGMGLSFILMLVDGKKELLRDAERKIDKYNRRIEEIIKLSPFPIVISKLSDDTILLANDNFKHLFGLKNKDLEIYRFKDFFVDPDNRRLLNAHLEKEQIIKDFEILVHSATNQTPFWLSTSANIIDYDYDVAIYAAFQDITDRKKRENLWQTQASRDPLTSLFNRRYFEEEVHCRASANADQPFSICMIDADHFKNVNDTYGHKTGDQVLITLASTTEKALRENDIVARYGGEEFVIYLPNTTKEAAKNVAERLRNSIADAEVISDSGEIIKFTVSIGIAPSDYSRDINELIKMSDDALYQAKERGRNCCVTYSPEINSEPENAKQQKVQDNIHPSLDPENNTEISLLGQSTPDQENPQ